MCGYCSEIYALAAVQMIRFPVLALANGRPDMRHNLMLQEAPSISSRFDGFERSPGRPESIIWLGRALQMLMDGGYDTPTYQLLIASPRFLASVNSYCGSAQVAEFGHAALPLDAAALSWLAERETWLHPGVFARHVQAFTVDYAASLLAQYAANCLHAAEHDEENSVAGENCSTTPAAPPTDEQINNWLLPLMMAIAKLATPDCPHRLMHEALWPIIQSGSAWTPGFDALELWIERQAALVLYDRFGVKPFADHLYWLRPELLQYLALTGRIDAQERARLLEAFLRFGTHGDGNIFSLHHWLVEGEVLQNVGTVMV